MRLGFLLVALAFGVACGDDSSADAGFDAGGDVTLSDAGDAGDVPVPVCDGVADLETGDATGHADPLNAGPTEARAGRLAAGDIPADPSDLLRWTEGDYVVANDRVALVIEQAGPSDGYDPFGGKPVGLARVVDGALFEPAAYNEVIAAVGRHIIDAESVTVMNDGSDGEAAVVRAVGAMTPIPAFNNIAAGLAPGDFSDLRLAIDYVLEPGSATVDVNYTVSNGRASGIGTRPLHLLFQFYRMPHFAADTGFDVPLARDLPWVGFAEDEATSYAIQFQPDASIALEISGALLFQAPRLTIPECANTEFPYFRMHIGRGMTGVRETIWNDEGTAITELTGVVRDGAGTPTAGVHVHAESEDGEIYYGRDLSDADGLYRIVVPQGVSTRLRAYRRGEGIVGPVAGPDIDLPAMGTIAITATDGTGAAIPVRVQSRPVGDGEPTPPDRFGEPEIQSMRTHVEYAITGEQELRVLPGMHRVIVSHGYEYTMFDSDITVTAGAQTDVAVTLDHVVDTTGVMCTDYHIHTSRSPDSPDSAPFKLASAAADGLEIPCRSDHEWVYEWEDIIADMGLQDSMFGVTSLELTTFAWGHFGVVPLEPQLEQVNRGAIDWIDRMPADVFAEVHARPENPAIIINHPRGTSIGGYFSAVGYDPTTGEVSNTDLWSEDWEAIEVFNDDAFDETMETVTDWFSFLNQGRRVWGVGSSDTHRVSNSPVGYPRSCLILGEDDPAALRAGGGATAVRDATREGRFTVSGGIYLTATARGDVGPGGEVTGAAATESVQVVVQAAPWVSVTTIEAWVDGVMVETIDIPASTDVIRFDEAIDVSGNWVVFHAKGEDRALDPVHPGRTPFGVTQPIFFVR